jgi:hypothetical protein
VLVLPLAGTVDLGSSVAEGAGRGFARLWKPSTYSAPSSPPRPPPAPSGGFGRLEIAWTRERLSDEAARRLGADPVELSGADLTPPHERRSAEKEEPDG